MNTWRDERDADPEDSWDDDEAASDDGSDDDTTIPCPACGCDIYDDTPRCPACGHYLPAEDRAEGRTPRWIVATAFVCLAIAVWLALTAF